MEKINTFEMLEDIRNLLDISISQFVKELNWGSTSYYYSIKRGSVRNNIKTEPSSPTISKVFDSVIAAINKYDNWNKNRKEIKDVCIEELFKNIK